MASERCCECNELTGRAGRSDDSIFAAMSDGTCEIGPLCSECYADLVACGFIEDN